MSYRVHRKTEKQKDRKTEKQKDRKTEKQKDRRTQNFFLLYRVLVVLKRRENTKKVGVKKFFFRHDSNTGRIPFEPRKIPRHNMQGIFFRGTLKSIFRTFFNINS